jgi:hypothetical protein
MKAPHKLALFGLGLLLIFAVSWGAGHAAGPFGPAATEADMNSNSHTTAPPAAPQNKVPGGLQISQDGYRLDVVATTLAVGDTAALRFRVIGPDGQPVTAYTTAHDKDLHLVLVRRDLTGFQHLHPTLEDGGVWSVPVTLADPGAYRMFADFTPAATGQGLILGADLTVPGDYRPQPAAGPSRTSTVDGYTVTLGGNLVPGNDSKLTLTVSKDGVPVTDLEPYLGAFGHLVALRAGDLAYLHVHPEESSAAGPQIVFFAQVPSAGNYGLFLDFKHHGTVRTAAFTATTGGLAPAPAASAVPVHPSPSETGHGH